MWWWKWVGHILRMEKNSNCETALTWTPEGRRKVGRPKTTWRSTIENERRILGWNSWNEARRVAADRTRWRRFTSALWATGPEEDRWGEVMWWYERGKYYIIITLLLSPFLLEYLLLYSVLLLYHSCRRSGGNKLNSNLKSNRMNTNRICSKIHFKRI